MRTDGRPRKVENKLIRLRERGQVYPQSCATSSVKIAAKSRLVSWRRSVPGGALAHGFRADSNAPETVSRRGRRTKPQRHKGAKKNPSLFVSRCLRGRLRFKNEGGEALAAPPPQKSRAIYEDSMPLLADTIHLLTILANTRFARFSATRARTLFHDHQNGARGFRDGNLRPSRRAVRSTVDRES